MKFIQILACTLSLLSPLSSDETKSTQEVEVQIKLTCPVSDEYTTFAQSIPEGVDDSVSYEEWRDSFVDSMTKLIALVKSGKIDDCNWSASAEDIDSTDDSQTPTPENKTNTTPNPTKS